MLFEPTWDIIVEPEKLVSFNQLEVIAAEGEPVNWQKRPELHKEVLNYWNKEQVRMTLERADELADALLNNKEDKVARMSRHIGGVAPKNRLSRAVFDGNKLYLALGTTDYMEFTGTNIQAISNPDFRERLMGAGFEDAADSNHYFASPLAVCAAVYGFNGKPGDVDSIYVPVGFRSKKVMIYPEAYHVFGGVGVGTDIGQHLSKELREEMGLKDDQMGTPTFHGIIRQGPSRVPEAICHIPVYVNQEELQ